MDEPDLDKIYLPEMARELRRKEHTVRQWIRDGRLPADLEPGRDGGLQRLYWTPEQLQGMRAFATKMLSNQGFKATA